MDDREIVALYWKRDQRALTETEGKYGGRLRQLGRRLIEDRETVEECENDTYFQAWNAIPPHEPRDYLFPFLGRIMRHVVLNVCEAGRCRKRAAVLTELTAEMEQCIPAPSDTAGEVDGILLGEAVSAFLRTIPEEQRVIFLRRYWYFDSVGDIARRCAVSASKVKSVLFRVRKNLRDYLIKEGYHL